VTVTPASPNTSTRQDELVASFEKTLTFADDGKSNPPPVGMLPLGHEAFTVTSPVWKNESYAVVPDADSI
jgi:hypothetical protein